MITIEKHSFGYRLKTEQRLPAPRSEVFPFFADASNLEYGPCDDHYEDGDTADPRFPVSLRGVVHHGKAQLVERTRVQRRRPGEDGQNVGVILDHPLRRQIIASQVANSIVDHMGITFVVHLLEFVGGSNLEQRLKRETMSPREAAS